MVIENQNNRVSVPSDSGLEVPNHNKYNDNATRLYLGQQYNFTDLFHAVDREICVCVCVCVTQKRQ